MNPTRTCIACRTKGDKNSFNRIIRTSQGEFIIDKEHKLNGRGAYFCKANNCIEKICKNKLLNRNYKTNVNDSIYKQLELLIK